MKIEVGGTYITMNREYQAYIAGMFANPMKPEVPLFVGVISPRKDKSGMFSLIIEEDGSVYSESEHKQTNSMNLVKEVLPNETVFLIAVLTSSPAGSGPDKFGYRTFCTEKQVNEFCYYYYSQGKLQDIRAIYKLEIEDGHFGEFHNVMTSSKT